MADRGLWNRSTELSQLHPLDDSRDLIGIVVGRAAGAFPTVGACSRATGGEALRRLDLVVQRRC